MFETFIAFTSITALGELLISIEKLYQVSRVYELALSMSEMVEKHTVPFVPSTRTRLRTGKCSEILPSNFVPNALRRNLRNVSGHMKYVETPARSRTASLHHAYIYGPEDLNSAQEKVGFPPSGGILDGDIDFNKDPVSAPRTLPGRRYKWSGKYAMFNERAVLSPSSDHRNAEEQPTPKHSEVRRQSTEIHLPGQSKRSITPYGEVSLTSSQVLFIQQQERVLLQVKHENHRSFKVFALASQLTLWRCSLQEVGVSSLGQSPDQIGLMNFFNPTVAEGIEISPQSRTIDRSSTLRR